MAACTRTLLFAALLGTLACAGLCLSAQQGGSTQQSSQEVGVPRAAEPLAGASKEASKVKAPPPSAPKPSPADDNAFPEEQSKAAQKQADEQEKSDRQAADTGSVAGSSPTEESGSSSRDKLAGMDVLGDRDSRISNGAGGTIVDPKLSTQDLKVGQQYMGMGNYQGAYERFKEACAVNPGNLEAVFYLAEAARKTAHLDESARNYGMYLSVEPGGSKAKAARKALAQLQGK